MFNKSPVLAIFAVFTVFFSSSLFASGGYSSGGSGGGSYGSTSNERKVDHAYENGKAIYNGRGVSKNVSYCIVDGSASVEVKRSSIRQLKGGKYADIGERLHNCENAKETMKALLSERQLKSVAYYLSKRYRLRLARS